MKRQNFSSKRAAILNAIRNSNVHPSAAWVYESLKDDYPSLSLGTVYRNISLFKKHGLINSVANIDGEERFDGITEPHAHFICSSCKQIIDISGLELQALNTGLEQGNFCVDGVEVTFYGRCDKCHSQRKKEKVL